MWPSQPPDTRSHMQTQYVMVNSDELSILGQSFVFALVVSLVQNYCTCSWTFTNFYAMLALHLNTWFW